MKTTILFLSALFAVFALSESRVHHKLRGRHRHSLPNYPERKEDNEKHCGRFEHHVICGPEKHCDKSCDNLYSPPYCSPPDVSNPKCYFPRCLCNEGFVRAPDGHCIRPSKCPHRYAEPSADAEADGVEEVIVKFRPLHHRRRSHRRKTTYFCRTEDGAMECFDVPDLRYILNHYDFYLDQMVDAPDNQVFTIDSVPVL